MDHAVNRDEGTLQYASIRRLCARRSARLCARVQARVQLRRRRVESRQRWGRSANVMGATALTETLHLVHLLVGRSTKRLSLVPEAIRDERECSGPRGAGQRAAMVLVVMFRGSEARRGLASSRQGGRVSGMGVRMRARPWLSVPVTWRLTGWPPQGYLIWQRPITTCHYAL